MYNNVLDWIYNFITNVGILWNWLITPLEITNELTIAPIYIICGGAIIVGIIRAIL